MPATMCTRGSYRFSVARFSRSEGIRQGEPGIVAVFEERPQAYVDRAGSFGMDLETPQQEGKLLILYLRPWTSRWMKP